MGDNVDESEPQELPPDEDPSTHTVKFTRGAGGFGFKIKGLVHGEASMEVVMQVINGKFYAPLQYVSGVDKGAFTLAIPVCQYVFSIFHLLTQKEAWRIWPVCVSTIASSRSGSLSIFMDIDD
jgi:hypothetical protein